MALVHVQIDHREPLRWTPALRARLAAVVRLYAGRPGYEGLQLDFEVRASERHVLLDLLNDLRRSLPASSRLSMTALASWCLSERWLRDAPVDEVVPMLFRMGAGGASSVRLLQRGGEFPEPRCRGAAGLATDTPAPRLPALRHVYLFDPRSWTPQALAGMLHGLDR